jgi:hypothetical protein
MLLFFFRFSGMLEKHASQQILFVFLQNIHFCGKKRFIKYFFTGREFIDILNHRIL